MQTFELDLALDKKSWFWDCSIANRGTLIWENWFKESVQGNKWEREREREREREKNLDNERD